MLQNFSLAFFILGWFTGLMLFWRLHTLDADKESGAAPGGGKASVIIPARNEAHILARLLDSLREQTIKPHEVILVDDNSTDGTGTLAQAYGVRVIPLQGEPPEGWLGKTWACWQGYLEARGDLLVFLDADVVLRPGALEKLLGLQEKHSGLVSVQPYHRMEKGYENFSLVFNLVVAAAMGVFSAWGSRVKPMGAFGPCLVCRKEDYEKAGTHQGVKGKVLDDIELGKAFSREGIPVKVFLGGRTVSFRMYPQGFLSLVEGWSKNIASGAGRVGPATRALLFIWITGAMAAGLVVAKGSGHILLLGFYFLYGLQVYGAARKIGNFNFLTFFLYPLYFLFFTLLFLVSLIRTWLFRSVSWKGRSIRLNGK